MGGETEMHRRLSRLDACSSYAKLSTRSSSPQVWKMVVVQYRVDQSHCDVEVGRGRRRIADAVDQHENLVAVAL